MSRDRIITPGLVLDIWENHIPTNFEVTGALGLLDELASTASAESNPDDRDIDIARFWLNATPHDLDYPDRWAQWKLHSLKNPSNLTYQYPNWTKIANVPSIEHELHIKANNFRLKGSQNELRISTTNPNEKITDICLIPSVIFDVVEPDTILIPEMQTPSVGGGLSERELYELVWDNPSLQDQYRQTYNGYQERKKHLKRFNRMRIGENTSPSMVFSLAIAAKIFAQNGFSTIKIPMEMPLREKLNFIVGGDSSKRIQQQIINVANQTSKRINGITRMPDDEYGYTTLYIRPDMWTNNQHLNQVLEQI